MNSNARNTVAGILAIVALPAMGCSDGGAGPNRWKLSAETDVSKLDVSVTDDGGRIDSQGDVRSADGGPVDAVRDGAGVASPEDLSTGPPMALPDSWSLPVVEGECKNRPPADGSCYNRWLPVLTFNLPFEERLEEWPGEHVPCESAEFRLSDGEYEQKKQVRFETDRCGRIRQVVQDMGHHSRLGPVDAPGEPHEFDGRADEAFFFNYDRRGQLEDIEIGYPDRSRLNEYRYEYAENGRLDRVHTRPERTYPSTYDFSYDHCGNRVRREMHRTNSGETLHIHRNHYGPENRLVKKVKKRSRQDEDPAVNRYEYDKQGREFVWKKTVEATTNPEFRSVKVVYRIGERGQPVLKRSYRRYEPEGPWKFQSTVDYVYDDRHRLTQRRVYDHEHPSRRDAAPGFVRVFRYDCDWSRP